MSEKSTSRFRLAINAVGTFALAAVTLPLGLKGLFAWATGVLYFGKDPDGSDKVLAVEILAVAIGMLALVSLVRTVQAWRKAAPGK